MTAKMKLVCLQNVNTYYHEEPKKEKTASRIIDAENSKKSRVVSLVGEETDSREIILIEKFQYFAALTRINRKLRVPCLIYPATSEKERLLHILKVSIPLEKDKSWPFYNKHVVKLLEDHNISIKEIADQVNQDEAKIRSYTLNDRIPSHIKEVAVEMNARITIQKICSNMVIPETLKTVLYEKAILDKDHIYRLTGKKLEHTIRLYKKHNIPSSLLINESDLEQFINELLANNFYLDEHYESLASSYTQTNNAQWLIFVKKHGLVSKKSK